METKTDSLDSWDDFIAGNFLKAINVDSDKDDFVVTEVSQYTDTKDNSRRPRLTLERNEIEYNFDLNKTNSVILKEKGVTNPKALLGAKLYFKKVLVRNPTTKAEVEGLRIAKVELPTEKIK